jgi:hypothetical protein
MFVNHFSPPGSGLRIRIRIRIQGPHPIESGSGPTAQHRQQQLVAHLKNIDGGAEVLGAELEQGGNPGQEAHQGRGGLRRVMQQRQPQLQTVLPQQGYGFQSNNKENV